MKRIIVVICTLLATSVTVGNNRNNHTASTNLKIVQQFVEAFNAHDVDGMMKLVSDDVEWLSVEENEVSSQTVGRLDTAASMKAYFTSTPTVRSVIVESMVVGSFVSIQERVYWEQKSVEKSQASLAVYEIRGGLIHRAWYYPAQQ